MKERALNALQRRTSNRNAISQPDSVLHFLQTL
jgi:hypothetical protein